MSRAGTKLRALVVCALLVASAGAQVVESKQVTRDQEALLRDANRELIHPGGEPLRIRGLEQDGNDMRLMTPALGKSDTKVALVDIEEARKRRLALYDQGMTIQAPLPVVGAAQAGEPRKLVTRRVADSKSQEASSTGTIWLAIAGVLATGAFLAWRSFRA